MYFMQTKWASFICTFNFDWKTIKKKFQWEFFAQLKALDSMVLNLRYRRANVFRIICKRNEVFII